MEIGFEGFGSDVRLATYLPVSDERQTVIAENFELGALAFDDQLLYVCIEGELVH